MEISEKIAQLLASPEVQAIISAIISLISANLVVWIGMLAKYIFSKNKQLKLQEDYEEKLANIQASYNAMAAKYYRDTAAAIKKLEENVSSKVDALEAERKKAIEEKDLELNETISLIKSSLNSEGE